MRFKDFEIRPYTGWDGKDSPDLYEVVKWYKTEKPMKVTNAETGEESMKDTFCYVLAFLKWDSHEPCWQLKSVGMRFADDYENGLCEFVSAYAKMLDVCKGYEDET